MSATHEHIARNFAAFQAVLPTLPKERFGKYALMRDEKILDFFDSAGDAAKAARLAYGDGKFSIQHVTQRPVDLGWFSHAVSCN